MVEGDVSDNISSTKPRKGVSKAGYSISVHAYIFQEFVLGKSITRCEAYLLLHSLFLKGIFTNFIDC